MGQHRRQWFEIALVLSALIVSGCPTADPGDPVVDGDPPPGSVLPEAQEIAVEVAGSGDVSQDINGLFLVLTATPQPGWQFLEWTGGVSSGVNPLTILPDDTTTVTATFVEIEPLPEPEVSPPDGDPTDDDGGDDDGDGIENGIDLCAQTAFGASVDAQGCSLSQKDSDGDGVSDDLDQCPASLAGDLVLATGCTLAESDNDGDRIPNDRDRCPESTPGAIVDATGCIAPPPPVCGNRLLETGEQCDPPDAVICDSNCRLRFTTIPVCGNSVIETGEQCDPPNTTTCASNCRFAAGVCGNGTVESGEQCEPPNTSTCSATCQTIVGTATCGNGVVESGEQCDSTNRAICGCDCKLITAGAARCGDCVVGAGEQCDPPNGTTCGNNCLTLGGNQDPQCGNSRIDIGEQCEPPNTATCDADCQTIIPRPENDACANPKLISAGTTMFTNVDALGDGPIEAGGDCASQEFKSDVWFCYTASVTTEVSVGLCGSSFDSMLAVYSGCACPAASALACNDDGCAEDVNRSELSFNAVAGQSYLLRAGGFRGVMGNGRITITPRPTNDSCANPLPLGDGATAFSTVDATTDGSPAGAPGCAAGDFSRDVWYCHTATCSGTTTLSTCNSSFDTMLSAYDGCACPSAPTLACNDNACADNRSEVEFTTVIGRSYLVRVGGRRGAEGTGQFSIDCTLGNTCGPGNGDCRTVRTNPGCEDERCCTAICNLAGEDFCCTTAWDEDCVILAEFFCP